jgi:hypothetical protein
LTRRRLQHATHVPVDAADEHASIIYGVSSDGVHHGARMGMPTVPGDGSQRRITVSVWVQLCARVLLRRGRQHTMLPQA